MSKVFSHKKAKKLDSWVRKIIQNPQKILKGLLEPDMTTLDFGAGSGFLTIPIAKQVRSVIAVDLQQEMLDLIRNKAKEQEITNIEYVQCERHTINVKREVDFVSLLYVVHEVPDQKALFEEIKQILKGKVLIAEPKHHVTRKEFEKTIGIMLDLGFSFVQKKKILMSHAAVLEI